MPYSVEELMKMSAAELDNLFRSSTPGPVPNGEAQGTAIIAPGTPFSPAIAAIINIFGWQGKTFDAASSTLVNRVTFFGISAIVAQIYVGPSLFDQKDCIVLDYSKTSQIAHWVRDEIRTIGPGMYLGIVYWQDEKSINFVLQFPDASK